MPAAVVGHVLLTDSTAAYGGTLNHGAANAVVVLDGTRTQRTDATGSYAFRLVTPGAHTVSVEPTSLGPGIVIDRENRAVTVGGGQTVSVDFYAGSFAGIGGRIMIHNGDGSSTPLAGVTVVVDKDVSTTTGPDGRYQVGRLTNGSHTVAIDTGTLPASVGMTGTAQRVVSVSQGAVTSVDWTVVGMAVIAGHVMYAPDAGMGEVRAAKDVYVLAEPGDHAAITNDDGSFALADLPPGAYTLSVDPDTVPDELGVTQGPDKPYTIQGGEHIGGIDFMLGAKAKDVVFSFSDQKKVPLAVRLLPDVVPPGSAIRVSVRPGTPVDEGHHPPRERPRTARATAFRAACERVHGVVPRAGISAAGQLRDARPARGREERRGRGRVHRRQHAVDRLRAHDSEPPAGRPHDPRPREDPLADRAGRHGEVRGRLHRHAAARKRGDLRLRRPSLVQGAAVPRFDHPRRQGGDAAHTCRSEGRLSVKSA